MRATSRRAWAVGVVALGVSGGSVFGQGPPDRPAPPGVGPDGQVHELTVRMIRSEEVAVDPAEAAGLPAGSGPELLNPERVFAYALSRGGDAPAGLTVDGFARFRKAFPGGSGDPSAAYLGLLAKLQRVENARRASVEVALVTALLEELVKGEASGLTALDLDQARDTAEETRRSQADALADFRDALDALKVELGLAPSKPLAVDPAPLKAFHDPVEAVRAWFASPSRSLETLPAIVGGFPSLDPVRVEGLAGLREGLKPSPRGEDGLEALLGAAVEAARKGAADGPEAARPAGDDRRLPQRVRGRVRRLRTLSEKYEGDRRTFLLAVRMRDQAFEEMVAPPVGAAAASAGPGRLLTLLSQHRRVREVEDRLVDGWAAFQAEQLGLCRDLGAFPFADWDGFLALFTARPGPKEAPAPAASRPTPPARLAPAPVPPATFPPPPAPPVPSPPRGGA